MARLHTGIIVLCLFALTCPAHAEVGTVRLLENHLLFASPATATDKPDQFVKVTCHTENLTTPATPTTVPIAPLARATVGETLTILDVLQCHTRTDGAYVQVRTVQHLVGYTQLPNYHTRIQTVDAEGAFKILFLIASPSCLATQFYDPDCQATGYADHYAHFVRTYPASPRVSFAAQTAATLYRYAATTYSKLADNPALSQELTKSDRYANDSTPTLLAKANEYNMLAAQMQALANGQPAPQQTASAPQTVSKPPASLNDSIVHNPNFPDFRKPTQQTAAAPIQQATPAPPLTQGNILTTIFYALLLLLPLVYIIGYGIRYQRITDHGPSGEVGNSIIEGVVFCLLAVAIAYLLADYLKPFVLIAFALLLYLRLETRLQPARDKRAADELKRKQETLKALTPLLNALHCTYGRYSDLPECYPAAWYAPRKHYIEYMADVLYTYHNGRNTYLLDRHGITADSPPFAKLRYLSFPSFDVQPAALQDPRHPYNVLIRAITDPNNPDHLIFRDLIPTTADLLPSLTAERWQELLARQAHELGMLVTQEITKQQYVIIGIPPNRDEYPLPVFYRDQRFRHTYIMGIFAQPLEPVHYAEKECWSDWGLSVGLRYR
jgi:hypothetical protein